MKNYKIIRKSIAAVAAFSLLVGGIAEVPGKSIGKKENFNKGVQNTVASVKLGDKGVSVADKILASAEVVDGDYEETEVKMESNQVVANIDSFLNIRSDASEDAEVVGKFYNGNVGTLIEQGDEWSLVASGNAYGYVKNEYILSGEVAESYIRNNCDQVARVSTETLNVRSESSSDSEIVALSGEGEALNVIGEDGDWVQVALQDDSVGYVSKDYVRLDYAYDTAITIEEENAKIEAEQALIAAALAQEESNNDNGSKEPAAEVGSISDESAETQVPTSEVVTSGTGQTIADFAVQFVGNPYVYGGSSLTNGADCSGFVMAVYANFGINLPHNAAAQAGCGRIVSVAERQPGDLFFYHGFGHVAIYIGNDLVVHASNPQSGIKISAYNYAPIDRVVRIVD